MAFFRKVWLGFSAARAAEARNSAVTVRTVVFMLSSRGSGACRGTLNINEGSLFRRFSVPLDRRKPQAAAIHLFAKPAGILLHGVPGEPVAHAGAPVGLYLLA